MDFDDVFPRLAGLPAATNDLAGLKADVRDVTLLGETKHLERLPSLSAIRRLWCVNTKRNIVSSISACTQLSALYLDALSASDLRFLRPFSNLEVLRLDGATQVTSFDPVGELRQLRGLSLEHFPKVRSIEPLAGLTQLEVLDVSGSIWTRMRVESLEPIRELKSLRFLSLTNLKPEDDSLRALSDSTALRGLRLANFYPVEEMARLAASLPTTSCDWFFPYQELGQPCEKCGAGLLMPTGKGKRVFCPTCLPNRRKRLEDEWDSMRSA